MRRSNRILLVWLGLAIAVFLVATGWAWLFEVHESGVPIAAMMCFVLIGAVGGLAERSRWRAAAGWLRVTESDRFLLAGVGVGLVASLLSACVARWVEGGGSLGLLLHVACFAVVGSAGGIAVRSAWRATAGGALFFAAGVLLYVFLPVERAGTVPDGVLAGLAVLALAAVGVLFEERPIVSVVTTWVKHFLAALGVAVVAVFSFLLSHGVDLDWPCPFVETAFRIGCVYVLFGWLFWWAVGRMTTFPAGNGGTAQ